MYKPSLPSGPRCLVSAGNGISGNHLLVGNCCCQILFQSVVSFPATDQLFVTGRGGLVIIIISQEYDVIGKFSYSMLALNDNSLDVASYLVPSLCFPDPPVHPHTIQSTILSIPCHSYEIG